MKKKLVASLAAAMVLGIAGTSFAASNPFVDVPAKHWSYDSVTKLAQAGVIDGYGDGTFRGDKTVTRYEMAQMVAKAMGNEGKATAVQKAEIKKLVAEYSDELDKLGVRVSNLEKNQSSVKLSGTMDVRYSAKDYNVHTGKEDVAAMRLRLEASAKVDDKSTVGFRFVNVNPTQARAQAAMALPTTFGFGLPTNATWTKFGNDNKDQTTNAGLDRFFIKSSVGQVDATLGRQALVVGTTGAIVDSGAFSFDGVKLATQMGQVNAAVNYGRLPGAATASADANNQKDIASLELSTKTGKLSYGAGLFNITDNAAAPVGTVKDILRLQYINAKYAFSNKVSMIAEAGQNKADYATDLKNKFYVIGAKFGDQVLAKAGDRNFVATYNYAGAGSLALDSNGAGLNTFGEPVKFGAGEKITQYNFVYNYAFSKNLSSQLMYFVGHSDVDANSYKMIRGVVTAKF